MTDAVDLSALLGRPESNTLDFKAKGYDTSNRRSKRDFAKDLASFANTPRETDAYIVLGVKKQLDGTTEILGLDIPIDDADLQSIASSFLDSVPQFSYQPVWNCGVSLGLITISPNQQYPVTPRYTHGEGFTGSTIYFRRGSQNAAASTREQERIWDWFHGNINPSTFDAFLSAEVLAVRNHIDADALLLGPVQALGLTSEVEDARRLTNESPADAVEIFAVVARDLREKFPAYADRIEMLQATALKSAGSVDESHDLLMKLAIREVFERAAPHLSSEVARDLEALCKEADPMRKARGEAIILFGRCHEYSEVLEHLTDRFDNMDSDDVYKPFIATLFAEVSVAHRDFEVVRSRHEALRRLDAGGNAEIALRIRAALGDAGVQDVWPELIEEAESMLFPSAVGAYTCLRGARWCAWNGQLDKAGDLYRLAVKLGSEAGLDLDVENSLWSLAVVHSLRDFSVETFEQISETRRIALTIEGSRSFVKTNSRTQQHSYQHLSIGQLPAAHLWTQFRLLESIRSGSLMDELDSHSVLARIYIQADEPLNALEHAILGGSQELVKDVAPKISEWPDYLADMLISEAPWVRRTSLMALKFVGDLAPPKVARQLVSELLSQFTKGSYNFRTVPTLLEALGAIILEATDEDIGQLIPYLEQASAREPQSYRLTDPGVLKLAARLYRFRSKFRNQAASILGEMAIGSHTGEWSRSLEECGDDTGELAEAFVRVAERENLDLAGPLSELGHVNEAARALWSSRLKVVAEHPLGKRSSGEIGPRYDVPTEFLRGLESKQSIQYIDKLVAIGSDDGQLSLSREAALAAAANVADVLSDADKRRVFRRVQPLAEQPIQVSSMDEFHASTQHPLSRFRISLGSATDVRASAGWLLGRAATNPDEYIVVRNLALGWVRSDDVVLQDTGASILTFPNISSGGSQSSELARHSNPSVRCQAVWMSDMRENPDVATLERLAADPDRMVRIAVAQALRTAESMDTESYERIRDRLNTDSSAIVRACASELPMI